MGKRVLSKKWWRQCSVLCHSRRMDSLRREFHMYLVHQAHSLGERPRMRKSLQERCHNSHQSTARVSPQSTFHHLVLEVSSCRVAHTRISHHDISQPSMSRHSATLNMLRSSCTQSSSRMISLHKEDLINRS